MTAYLCNEAGSQAAPAHLLAIRDVIHATHICGLQGRDCRCDCSLVRLFAGLVYVVNVAQIEYLRNCVEEPP